MLKNYQTTLKISSALVEAICKRYGIRNVSKAVSYGLTDFFLLPKKKVKLNSFALHQLLSIDERKQKRNVSIRLPKVLYDKTLELSYASTMSETAEILLAIILYYPLENVEFPKENLHLLRILGSKFNKKMDNAIANIFKTAGRTWDTSVETCSGALGIHCNHCVAHQEIINDDDWQKINLYKAVQANHRELLLQALSLDASPTVFSALKEQSPVQPSNAINYVEAAKFLYLNATTCRNSGSSFLDTMTNTLWHKRLQNIYSLHKRLQTTVILETDLFKVINKYRKSSNTLFIIDPPYLDANVYKDRLVRNETEHGKEFGWREHLKLAKLLQLISEKDGNDFIYFCRITATRKKNKKNQIIISEEELEANDRHMNGMVDDLYYGHDFYYIDVGLNQGVIERIITSFPFEGATLYNNVSE